MKIQNMAVIFIVIILPILMILGYYLKLQEDTLEMQEAYNTKLATATKEGIRAYEINTVNWRNTKGELRRNVTASVNTFLTSLANNLGIAGTAKEYMVNYVPAVVMTMYDGYYIYAPSYVAKTLETEQGIQLYYKKDTRELTTEPTTGGVLNDIAYVPKSGGTSANYTYTDGEGTTHRKTYNFTTDATAAIKEYIHALSNEIPYAESYTNGNVNVTINYTLDNRIYVYGKDTAMNKDINEQGTLVYFKETDCKLPRISMRTNDPKKEEDIIVTANSRIDNTIYNGSNINAEELTEQIAYITDSSSEESLATYKYLYDVTGEKLYYDDSTNSFFTWDADSRKKIAIPDRETIKAGDDDCRYKSVSILTSDTTYKKLYQVLNGRDKGKWYISLKNDPTRVTEIGPGYEVIDTEIKAKVLEYGFSAIYMDYSAISYYVEAYAFTNWMRNRLGGIFNITESNDIEKVGSPISEHKREVMINHITSNLNLSISNYARNNENGNSYRLPVLTALDWDQIFKNISMVAFFQGVPIGLKTYNNYAIATSTLNRDYVAPDELYFTSNATSYHRPYCTELSLAEVKNDYTGYRSVEYSLRTIEKKDDKALYYYQHSKQPATPTNKSSDLACYYCLVNKANYEKTIDIASPTAEQREIKNIQAKAYREALARERYYQNEKVKAKLGIMIRYHENVPQRLFDLGVITSVSNMPNPTEQEAEPNVPTTISNVIPIATTSEAGLTYRCVGWSKDPNSSEAAYVGGDSDIFEESIDLYAIWVMALGGRNWQTDYKWTYGTEFWNPSGEITYAEYQDLVKNDSISNIRIYDDTEGSTIEMVGNPHLAGKGAVWTTLESAYARIKEYSFEYEIKQGDSFNAAGLMFNLTETATTLEGYLFSINFDYSAASNSPFYIKAGRKTGAIYKFKYNKNANTSNVESIELVQAVDLGTSARNSSGTMNISVTDSGYKISVENETGNQEYDISVPASEKNPNAFGFFSDHYGHGCYRIGYFKLSKVKVIVEFTI